MINTLYQPDVNLNYEPNISDIITYIKKIMIFLKQQNHLRLNFLLSYNKNKG